MIARAGHYEPIAREAFPYMIPPLLCALGFWWFTFPITSLLFLLAAAVVALFFRNPPRTPPVTGEDLIISPADGRVVEVVEDARSDNMPDASLKRMSIFMSVFNVHVNRSPVSGTVRRKTYSSGAFHDAREKAASEENERNSLVIDGENGALEVVQVAGKVARKISCWVAEGDPLRQGERFGLIHFGSRLDVYLPPKFSFVVPVGTRVRAGVTVIAERAEEIGK
jgi:phosphatidylserine decarboxylase